MMLSVEDMDRVRVADMDKGRGRGWEIVGVGRVFRNGEYYTCYQQHFHQKSLVNWCSFY